MAAPAFSSLTFTAIQAALKAGDILKRGFGTSYEISNKPGRQNFVTEYDHAAEDCIISFIKDHFPSHNFLAEESGLSEQSNSDEVLWIIDPLDGTTNFSHHIPIFTISIAATHLGKEICGVIFQPLTQELFIGEKGKGAYLNGARLEVSKTKQIEDALIITGLSYEEYSIPTYNLDRFTQLTQKGTTLRNLGSAALALAYVAAGKADAFWMYNLHPWDIAAGQILIEEAGGYLIKDGNESNFHPPFNFLATNQALHPTLKNFFFSNNPS